MKLKIIQTENSSNKDEVDDINEELNKEIEITRKNPSEILELKISS